MKKFAIFISAVLLLSSQCFAGVQIHKTSPIGGLNNSFYKRNPINRKNYRTTRPYRVNNNNDLSRMERALFRKNYNNDNINSRLDRLEENMYGRRIPGTVADRYRNLSNSFYYNNPGTYYDTYNNYNAYSPYPLAATPKMRLLDRISNYFMGTSTGISPSMDGFFTEQYSTSPWGRGYYSSNKNYGTGSTVRILD